MARRRTARSEAEDRRELVFNEVVLSLSDHTPVLRCCVHAKWKAEHERGTADRVFSSGRINRDGKGIADIYWTGT